MAISIAGLVFIVGYAAIALEHKIALSKSAVALFIGIILWIIVSIVHGETALEGLTHTAGDIFSIIVFLLAAMSLVEVLVHYKFFDLIRGKIFALKLTEKKQFIVISSIAFILSAFLDNLTTTIVMIQISRKFFKGENMIRAAACIIISANAGGAFSPIGDVTTIMLWFAGKFSALELISRGILPATVLGLVSMLIMVRGIKGETIDSSNEIITSLTKSEKIIIIITLLSFMFPVLMNLVNLPPYMGLLLGLALVWLTIDITKQISNRQTHLEASLDEMMRKTDIPSLKFFIGILFAVAALGELGVLKIMADYLYGSNPGGAVVVGGNIGLGFLSAILDNVPLTAMAIEILPTEIPSLWVLLALTAGTGGSLLVIGSAAGVVAMGMVKELSFTKYFKVAFFPALVGYLAAIAVWCFQYFVLGF
jgi:Na+/H+ antiporter NhaD/arsenite permease-like protein